ncbi:MAG: LuxR C-terminal-related transcriptional regulator [Caldilineaceae bacterium]
MNSSATPSEPVILLQTKLYAPKPGHHFIQRPRLIEHLNRGLDRKLTLITAPAGYGKTTLVCQWLMMRATDAGCATDGHAQLQGDRQRGVTAPVAWISLDEYDNDLHLFVRYLIAAIQTVWPNSCSNTLTVLQNPQQAPEAYLANVLVNDLIVLPEALILVLDDYHFVKENRIHQFLNRLLNHWPQSVHLVLTSRTEPPLALPPLRVRQQMSELRVADLSFSNTEAEHYLTHVTGRTFAPETVSALQDQNEGWIAGLYLATLSLHDNASEQALVRRLQTGNVNILDYLFTEVLVTQPAAIQDFLLRTAILNRFCLPLCETLLESAWQEAVRQDQHLAHIVGVSRRPVQSIIEWLARHHLFFIALDDTGEWYRYHHLFQLMLTRHLQKQLDATEILALHQRVSRWFVDQGLIDEAIQHALAADDPTFAARLIEEQRLALLARFDYVTLERWLALLPEVAVEQSPKLLLLKCWIAVSLHRLTTASVMPLLQQVAARLKEPDPALDADTNAILWAEVTALQGAVCILQHDFAGAIAQIVPALEVLPISYVFMRTLVIFYVTLALQATGQVAIGIGLIHNEIKNEVAQFSLAKLWLQTYLAGFDYLAGNLQRTVQSAQSIIQQIEERSNGNQFLLAVPYRWLGAIHYEWNNLPMARHYLLQVDRSNSTPYFQSCLILAWLYELEGQRDKAQQVVEDIKRWVQTLGTHTFDQEIASFQARCLYWQGKLDPALQAQRAIEIVVSKQGVFTSTEIPALTLIKILLAQESESGWREAEELLSGLWAFAENIHSLPGQVEILTLKALLHQRFAQHDAALAALERAIGLAKPGGFIRTFVDLGPPMAGLLYQLLAQGVETAYLGRILAAFPQAIQDDESALRVQQAAQTQLIEALTARESEILLLLQEGQSNKAIARDLDISALTVKRHSINLYQKLGVNSRKQAVARAKALGILPADH